MESTARYVEGALLGALSVNNVKLETFTQPGTVSNIQWCGNCSETTAISWTCTWAILHITEVTPPNNIAAPGGGGGPFYKPEQGLVAYGIVSGDSTTSGGSFQSVRDLTGILLKQSIYVKPGDSLWVQVSCDYGNAFRSIISFDKHV